MSLYLIPLIISLAIVVLLGTILAKRHGRSIALKTTSSIVAFSFLVAFIIFQILIRDVEENINPAVAWQKITTLDGPASKLQYYPASGLFALTDHGEIKITGVIPFCSPDGHIASSYPNEIEVTTEPLVSLPVPPQPVKQKVSFNIRYPVEDDSWAASSFAVYENSEVWCTERLAQGGPTGAMALGFAGFIFLYLAFIIFAGSFVLLSILVIISLEIQHRRKRNKEKATSD